MINSYLIFVLVLNIKISQVDRVIYSTVVLQFVQTQHRMCTFCNLTFVYSLRIWILECYENTSRVQ